MTTELNKYLAARAALSVNDGSSTYFAARDAYVAARAAYAAARAAVCAAHEAYKKSVISADAGIFDTRKTYFVADAALRAAREDFEIAHDVYCTENANFISGAVRDANYADYVVARDAYDAIVEANAQ